MNAPKMELKNIKTFRGMEGQGLNADLYINGIKCYFVIDEGNGGCFNYQSTAYNNPKAAEVNANIKLLEDYIASLPEEPVIIDNKHYMKGLTPMMMKKDLDMIVDELFNLVEKEKAAKKKCKLFETAIVYGVPNADRYAYIYYKVPLSKIPLLTLQMAVNKIKKNNCDTDVVIFNDNLEALGVKL